VPLHQLQKFRGLGLRPQLPHDEDEDRIPERARPRAIVQGWRDQVGKGVGTLLLLGLRMLERFPIYLSIYWIRLIRMVVITPTTGYCGHGLIVAITHHSLLIIL
jgi:hypothetical protein